MHLFTIVLFGMLSLSNAEFAEELYDYACCPKDDCHSALTDPVKITAEGYHVKSLETVIAQDDPRIRVSKDGQFHICTRSTATPDMTQTAIARLAGTRTLKCLYVPPFS